MGARVHVTRLLLSLLLVAVAYPPAAVAQNTVRPPTLSAEAFVLLDLDGRTLHAKNAGADRAPASLVKLMTLYLACEALDSGRVTLDEPVTVSRHAAFTPRYRMGLRTGAQVPLQVLLEGVAIASANDAATALAEHLAGDEATFVAQMNDKGRDLGLADTRFANPHGLPDPLQRSTARDLAQLTVRLLSDCPMSRPLLGGQTFVYNGRVYARHIPLFNDPGGVQALKTGFTKEAGYNLSVSAWRDGHQFLMIVLGSRSRSLSFLDAKRLLRFGFVETGLEEPAAPKQMRRRPGRARRDTRSATPVRRQ
jgi:D-alanyl-D-alanine carboxypeptidase